MTSLTVEHTTCYRYRTAVSLGPHRLMLRPRETRDVSLASFDLEISPKARIDWCQDVAGNTIATALFEGTTDVLSIRSCARVDLNAPAWPVFPISANGASYPFRYTADDQTDLGVLATPQYANDTQELARWVEGFVLGRPTDTLSLLKDICNGTASQVGYQSREREGTQTPWRFSLSAHSGRRLACFMLPRSTS